MSLGADPHDVLDRWIEALNTNDFAALDDLLTEDCVMDYPQSGEIVRGRKNFRAILENYPNRLERDSVDPTSAQLIGADQWAITPSFALVRIAGTGDSRTMILKSRYPDGSVWWLIHFTEFSAGKISKSTVYFAPVFEPPPWRAAWVERRV
ncbi:MAG TPA: nuclear transport factor 2 family protein [Candidatus Limnocylindria bacterium]|nr:nuclear transport factor 2 family protein [Candidatus Limnocylindria bacterium]